jgi:hypothetical protein
VSARSLLRVDGAAKFPQTGGRGQAWCGALRDGGLRGGPRCIRTRSPTERAPAPLRRATRDAPHLRSETERGRGGDGAWTGRGWGARPPRGIPKDGTLPALSLHVAPADAEWSGSRPFFSQRQEAGDRRQGAGGRDEVDSCALPKPHHRCFPAMKSANAGKELRWFPQRRFRDESCRK